MASIGKAMRTPPCPGKTSLSCRRDRPRHKQSQHLVTVRHHPLRAPHRRQSLQLSTTRPPELMSDRTATSTHSPIWRATGPTPPRGNSCSRHLETSQATRALGVDPIDGRAEPPYKEA